MDQAPDQSNNSNFTPLDVHDHHLGTDHSHLRVPLMIGAFALLLIFLVIIFLMSRVSPSKRAIVAPTATPSISVESPTLEPTSAFESTTSADLPPLYPGVEWEATESGQITIYKTDPYGPENINGYRIQSVKVETYPADVVDYYKSQLELGSWNLIAETDNTFFYEKGEHYVSLGVNEIKLPKEQYQIYIEFD